MISGQDLPIKTNEEIKIFFEGNNMEYIQTEKIPTQVGWPDMNRIKKYHFNQNNNTIYSDNFILKITKKVLCEFISIIKPRKLDYDFYGGSNWTNYTHNCVNKIFQYLDNNPRFINRFKWTFCADEIFYQTILNQLDGLKIINDNLRSVNWNTDAKNPDTIREEDFENLIRSKALFARKFDENIDKKIIELIYNRIKKQKEKH